MLDKKFIGGGFYYENCETYEAWLEDSSIGSVEIVYNDYGYPAYYKVKALKVGKTRIHIKCSNSSSDWEGSYGVFVTGPSISYYDSNKIELTVGQSCTRWFIPSDYASLYYHFEQWNKTSSDIVDVVFLDANNKEVDLNNIQNYAKVKNIKVTAKKAGTTELTAEARAEDGNHYGAYTDPAWKIVVKEPLTYQVTADNVKNNNWTNSETTKFTITFNQDVDGFTLDDISLSSELKNPIFKKVNNKQYELTVTNPELAMGIGIYIKPNSCTVSGTSKLFNSSKMYYYCVDRIKPTVNITKVETDNTDNTYANKDSTITIEFNISDNGYFYGSAGDLVKKQNFKAFVVDAGESNYIQEGVEFEKIGTSESKRSYRVRIKNIEKYEGKLNFQILNNDTSLSDLAGNTRKEEYILHKGTGNIKFNPDGNQGAVGKAKTMATLTDEKNEYKSIKYAWKEEGKEPEESEYKENYKVEQYKKGQEIESEELYDGKYNLYIRTEDSKGNINVVKSKTFEIRGKIQTPGEIEFRENTEDGEKIEAKENEIKTKENVWIKIINQGKDPYGEVETTFEIRKEENVVAVGNNTIEIVTLTNQGEYELTLISKRVNKTNPELEVENKTTYKIIVDKEGPKVVFERKSQDNQKEGQIQVTITDEGTAQTGVKEETLRYYWTNGNYKPGKEDFEGESQEGYKGKIEGTKAVIKTPKNESGIWVLWVYAEDQVGNVTIKQERTIGDNDTVIDNQAPVAGKLEITTLEENGEEKEYKTEKTQDEQKEEGENTNKDIKIKLLPGYDSISGVKSNTYEVEKENGEKIKIEGKTEFEGEITLTEHGIYKATVTTIDKAQGQNTSTRQYIIKIDKEGPKVTYENTENGENGSKESIEKVKVRPTVVDEAGVENSALKYSWVKFESVEKYNEFQKAEKTIEKLKEKMGEGKTFSNGEEISSPENIEGIYSLFVYAKDKLGNESVSYSEYYAFKLGKDEKHEYVLAGEYITKVKPETKVEDFIEKVKTVVAGSTYEVYDKKGNEIEEGNIVTTASTINVDGKTYTIIVVGDLNGDGKLTGTDLVQMRFSRVGKYELKGAYEKAADINSDGKVTGTDLVQMRLIKVGLADYTE